MTFAKRLRRALTRSGMTSAALADRAEISRSMVSQYLSGHSLPPPTKQDRLAAVLGVNVADLRGDGEIEAQEDNGKAWVRRVSPAEAAALLEKDVQCVRRDLQAGVAPFGYATPPMNEGEHWDYHISRKLLEEYIGKF